MDETIDAAQVDECAEVDDGGDVTRQDHALLQLAENLGALVLATLFEDHAARKDNVVAVAVHLNDACLKARAGVGSEVLDATEIDERSRQEAAQADVEDESTLDDLDDFAFDILAGVELLFDLAPGALVLRALLGKDKTTVLVFLLQDERLNSIAAVIAADTAETADTGEK